MSTQCEDNVSNSLHVPRHCDLPLFTETGDADRILTLRQRPGAVGGCRDGEAVEGWALVSRVTVFQLLLFLNHPSIYSYAYNVFFLVHGY